MKRFPTLSLLAVSVLALSSTAHAHPGTFGSAHGESVAFWAGAVHPLMGLDHLLAIIAAGLWASRSTGSMRARVPVLFVVAMVVGSAIGHVGGALPGIEHGVAASVFVLGLLAASARILPSAAVQGLTLMFAAFHGYAHGVEIPNGASAPFFTLGFASATASLLALTVFFSTVSARLEKPFLIRRVGAVIAFTGAVLWVF